MTILAQVMLLAWLPVVLLVFTIMPPRKAAVRMFVAAWLFLPNGGYSLPGLPDYTKMVATGLGVLLGAMIYDQGKFLSIVPRWFDIPILAWCFGPFVTAIYNGLGPYEATSSVLSELISWGLPYLVGRVYLDDVDGLKELAEAIVIGGLCYIPLCLFEIRFSPSLQSGLYGIVRWEGVRYGGYRPKVFLATGLELGMWMTNATLMSYMLWSCGTIKTIRGFSFGLLMLALAVTTMLCKSTGALMLLGFGLVMLWVVRRFGWTWLLWLMIAIPPAYTISRGTNIWSARELVTYSRAAFGEERAQSLEYRFDMEDLLVARASERPILGWGRFNRFQVTNKDGATITIPDGFWIIALGTQGIVGLSSILVMFLLPLALTIRRFPVSTWSDPRIGPSVIIALILALTMIDFLSNAMLNPMYPLAIGGILGQKTFQSFGSLADAEEALGFASELVVEGRTELAEVEFRRAIERSSGQDDLEGRTLHAKALDGLGQSLLASGRPGEAEEALREALIARDLLAGEAPDPGRFCDLAIAREGLARALAEIGRVAEAIEERRIALQIWDRLATNHPGVADYRAHRANGLNDLAWLMATQPDPSTVDPSLALALAEEAIRESSDHDALANTLGVARYRAGDWTGAIEALERSALSSPGGAGTAFDHYFLAMAWCQLGHEDRAREWLERGIAWASRHRPDHSALERFRRETESLMEKGA
jgi:tetratricopeptide (TPR) repeat protein